MNTLVQNNNTIISRELTAVEMENIAGQSAIGCASAVLGVIGIVGLFTAAAPVGATATGWMLAQATATGFGWGLSLGDCFIG